MISGPTGSGKTHAAFGLLRNFHSQTTIPAKTINVLYCYSIWQEQYANFKSDDVFIQFYEGFCTDFEDQHPTVIVIDDLMEELAKDKTLVSLFTKASHHKNISIIFLTQNLFVQSREMRTVSLNCHYIFLMKNPRDRLQIQTLARQMYPQNSNFFMRAYDEAVAKPFSYLIVDMTGSCQDKYRLRQRENVKGVSGYIVFEPT